MGELSPRENKKYIAVYKSSWILTGLQSYKNNYFLYNCVIPSIQQKHLPLCIIVKCALKIQTSNIMIHTSSYDVRSYRLFYWRGEIISRNSGHWWAQRPPPRCHINGCGAFVGIKTDRGKWNLPDRNLPFATLSITNPIRTVLILNLPISVTGRGLPSWATAW